MFMRDQMYKTTRDTFNTLMRTRDAHSLECLCVLLTIIGPKLKKVINYNIRHRDRMHWTPGTAAVCADLNSVFHCSKV